MLEQHGIVKAQLNVDQVSGVEVLEERLAGHLPHKGSTDLSPELCRGLHRITGSQCITQLVPCPWRWVGQHIVPSRDSKTLQGVVAAILHDGSAVGCLVAVPICRKYRDWRGTEDLCATTHAILPRRDRKLPLKVSEAVGHRLLQWAGIRGHVTGVAHSNDEGIVSDLEITKRPLCQEREHCGPNTRRNCRQLVQDQDLLGLLELLGPAGWSTKEGDVRHIHDWQAREVLWCMGTADKQVPLMPNHWAPGQSLLTLGHTGRALSAGASTRLHSYGDSRVDIRPCPVLESPSAGIGNYVHTDFSCEKLC